KKSFQQVKIIIFALIVSIPIGFIVINMLNIISPDTLSWMYSGIEEIYKFLFEGEETGIFIAFRNFTFFPDDIIFGAGSSPDLLINRWSDIGYIICIWDYGIFGTILLLGGYIMGMLYCIK